MWLKIMMEEVHLQIRMMIKKIRVRIRVRIVTAIQKIVAAIQKIVANNNMIQIIKNNIHKYKESFSFAFLLSYLDLNIPNDAEPITQISFGFLILSLIVLSCFTNVIGYLSFVLLIKYYKLGDKYPKFNKILSLFEKSSIMVVVIEGLVGYIFLFAIIIFSFLYLTQAFT
uniref:Uncharacterized protein n=1 Tax=Tricholoma terreum TaxID=76328 RepID=A0A6C0W3P4_9AGAR|nr:hypothetical protein [Tricholoma terreum]QIC20238.1 hypothetical protein [Tricholoma terreum]